MSTAGSIREAPVYFLRAGLGLPAPRFKNGSAACLVWISGPLPGAPLCSAKVASQLDLPGRIRARTHLASPVSEGEDPLFAHLQP